VRAVKRQKQHVRFKGEEFAEGDILLHQGTPLHPARIALLASVGISEVTVYHRPRVAVILPVRKYSPMTVILNPIRSVTPTASC